MYRKLLSLPLLLLLVMPALAQESWTEYYSDNQVTIESKYSECHYSEKGIHNEYLLMKVTNKTSQEIQLAYKLDKWYNNSKINPDKSDFAITVPANSSVESTCDDLQEGLHVYSKILDQQPRSKLNKFELNNLTINGSEVAR